MRVKLVISELAFGGCTKRTFHFLFNSFVFELVLLATANADKVKTLIACQNTQLKGNVRLKQRKHIGQQYDFTFFIRCYSVICANYSPRYLVTMRIFLACEGFPCFLFWFCLRGNSGFGYSSSQQQHSHFKHLFIQCYQLSTRFEANIFQTQNWFPRLFVPSLLHIFKISESMADLPEDLNFGVTMQGSGAAAPPPKPVQAAPKPSDEVMAANSDQFDLKKAGHPVACIATFAFKALGVFFYLIIGSLISNITTFIIVIIFSSLDFWVVKNITGRLLVGLRWWSQIDKTGKEQWRFENPSEGRVVNPVDNAFFWCSQVAGTLIWGILLVLKVLTLSIFWALLLFVCTSLCATNLYAYYQCRGDHQKKLGQLKKKGMMQFIGKAFG